MSSVIRGKLHNFLLIHINLDKTAGGARLLIKTSIAIALVASFLFVNIDFAAAHIIGDNVTTKMVGSYEVRFQAFPLYPNTERPTSLGFSVLDQQGYNVWNMEASVKVQKDGSTIFTSPKTKHEISDIFVEYVFPEKGNYLVMLEANIPNEPDTVVADFQLIVGQDTDSFGFLFIVLTGSVVGGVTGALFLVRRAKGNKRLRPD
ncbi:MAG: hypothetical protein ACRD5H_10640 [Nitrososphaerales archaeon]